MVNFVISGFLYFICYICQDQTSSTKGSTGRSLQAPLAETEHENVKPQNEGCHAAWRLQSAPGPKAPEACFARTSLSLSFTFLLMYFLSVGYLKQ